MSARVETLIYVRSKGVLPTGCNELDPYRCFYYHKFVSLSYPMYQIPAAGVVKFTVAWLMPPLGVRISMRTPQ